MIYIKCKYCGNKTPLMKQTLEKRKINVLKNEGLFYDKCNHVLIDPIKDFEVKKRAFV